MMDGEVSFGNWIRKRRRALDFTQEELARRVGCSVSALRKIEDDERRPSRQLAEILAARLEIPEDQKTLFLQVARKERQTTQLGSPQPRPPAVSVVQPQSSSIPPSRLPVAQLPVAPLPVPPTPLVGRETELAEIVRLLSSPDCRVLSLVGPGGVGKTRLALEGAARLMPSFQGRIDYVSLVSLATPDLLVPAIASAVGLTFYGSEEPRAQLIEYLRYQEGETLLVLDNFEHLLAGADLCADILTAAPHVRLFVTSRERLLLQSEWVLEVQGLPVPSECGLEEAAHSASVHLFLQCAQRARHDFTLTEAECPSVVRICQLVTGMPLGIELAASWVRTLSCAEIAEEIERNLDFLSSSARDLPQRHRSLRVVFDQSWKLLNPEEQAALRKLSVFRGGFQRDAAERVAGTTLNLLSALIDKSLVRRGSDGRYDLHELTAQYAAARLAEDVQEEHETRARHCKYYMAFVENHRPMLESARQKQALAEISAEIGNIRSAVDWSVAEGCVERYRMALHTLRYFTSLKEWHQDGLAMYRRIVGSLRSLPDEMTGSHVLALGHMLAAQGWFATKTYQAQEAQAVLQESLELLASTGDPIALGSAHHWMGYLQFQSGDYIQSGVTLRRCLQYDYPFSRAFAFSMLGELAQIQGDLESAYRWAGEALPIWRSMGDPRGLVYTLNQAGLAAHLLGREEEAQALLSESVALGRERGDPWGIGTALERLGMIAMLAGNYPLAIDYFRQSSTMFPNIGERFFLVQVQLHLGEALTAQGQWEEARQVLHHALSTAYEIHHKTQMVDAMLRIAYIHHLAKEYDAALSLIIVLKDQPVDDQGLQKRVQRLYENTASQLAESQVKHIQAEAQSAGLDEVVQRLLKTSGKVAA